MISKIDSDTLSFEEIHLGDKWTSECREINLEDVLGFATLTGDNDRLHTDPEFAKKGPFGKPVAHGLLGMSVLAGLSSTAPKVQTAALVDIRNWNFCRPIYPGDSVHVVTEVIELRPRGRRHGEVHWYRQLINQRGEKVQDGVLVTLVSRRAPLPNRRRETTNVASASLASTETADALIG